MKEEWDKLVREDFGFMYVLSSDLVHRCMLTYGIANPRPSSRATAVERYYSSTHYTCDIQLLIMHTIGQEHRCGPCGR